MQTLRIVVCDDDEAAIVTTAQLLKVYLDQQKITMELHPFTDAQACLTFLEQHKVDIIFLDIFLDHNLLGTDLGLRLRAHNKDAKLIFLSTSNEFATESFAAQASYYLIKPLTQAKLEQALARCELFTIKHYVNIDTGREILTLDPASVIALEVQNKYTFIYTANDLIKVLCPLTKFFDYFHEPDFLLIHRSYLINLKHVASLENDYFLMDNNFHAPIKSRGTKAIKDYYMQWLLENMD